MPGRLIMDQQGASLSQAPKKDRSQAQTGSTSHAEDFATKHATSPQAGGPNGVRAKEKSPLPPMTNGHVEVGAGPMVASSGTSSPPALDQSWRESHANKSMGVLIERLAQKCFSDLSETVAKMSDLPVPSASAQPNGISLHNIDTSADSLARKRMWMEFAQNQRDRFIKTLVLADWSRSGHDMAKLIDIRVWEDKQRNSQSNAISFIGTIKHNLMSAKMPNPNIEGALELLATGKASHIPDLGYLPPKRLTSKQLLRTLQNMNVTLVTRLNLHEDLPSHFNEYSIADGRATFRVAEEFEVDLSVADEDPASPFYFIDIRFLFSPTSHILNEQLRAALEVRCNSAMAGKGLQGCYDFLHNFVLTHKINVLRGQADELKRGKWFDCLYINTPRRVLSVQYWSSRVGPKSWLEFGIATGKQKGLQSRKTPTPRLRVRWFREAVEVDDDSIDVDWQNIDLEKILFAAIAKHTSWLLRNLETRLNSMAGDQSKVKAILTTSAEVPEECSLDLTFQALRSPLTVKFDSVTGAISLSPPTPLNHNVEVRLNRDPKLDKPVVIANLLCSAVHDRVSKMAELLAWASVSGLGRQDNLSQLFGKDVLARSIYVCSKGWGSDWALVTTFSLSGERWWVVRLANKPGDKSLPPGRIISTARQVPVSDVSTAHPTISQQHLLRVERLAEAEVSFTTLSRQLVEMRIQHHFERLAPLTPEKISASTITPSSVAMYIKSSALLGDTLGRKKTSWATEFVRITHETVEPDVAVAGLLELRHDIRVTVKSGRLSHLQKRLVHSQQSDIAMNASEALALRIRVPFGQPFAEQLRARLHSVERLDHYLAILESQNFRCIGMDLSKLTFRYGESLPLTAQLSFSKDGSLPVRLKFEPQGNNPHQRMRAMLEKHINGQNKGFFAVLTKILSITLPLLQSLDQIESRDISRASVLVHVRQPLWFNLTYKSPLPPCAFEIRCRNKQLAGKAEFLWHISRSERPGSPTMPESITAALRELYQSQEKDWWGIGGGIVAKPAAVGDVLEQLDNTMRKFEGVEIKPPPEELDAKPLIQQTTVKTAPPSQLPKPQQAPQQTQPQPQPMQRQPSQQRQAPVMQRQASQQAAAPMQRQASQQHAQQMQRQLSQQQMQRNFAQQQQQGQGQRPQMTTQQRMQLFQQQQQAQQQAQQQPQQQKPRPMSANAGYLPQNRPPNGAAPPNTRGDVIEID